jgi:AraC-like DNA-binding protein
MASPLPTIAATSTLAMVRTAGSRGIKTTDVLAREGLSLAALEDPDCRLPAPTVMAIWKALRERTGDPALQLVAPTSLPFGAYRVIDFLVGASATVGEGIGQFARFFGLIADAVELTIESRRDGHCLCLAREDGNPVPPVYVDYVFAALVSRVRMRIRPDLRVARVELRQAEPADTGPYWDVFCAPVRFDAAADRLCFAAEEWRLRIEGADAALARLLEEHARILAERTPQRVAGFRAEVQKAIAAAPSEGASVEIIARALNMSVRTLQRRLVADGTTFKELAESVRGQLAMGYLNDPKVSIAEVAFLLGFSEQSSFNRAFRRWTGQAPGQWRRAQA